MNRLSLWNNFYATDKFQISILELLRTLFKVIFRPQTSKNGCHLVGSRKIFNSNGLKFSLFSLNIEVYKDFYC